MFPSKRKRQVMVVSNGGTVEQAPSSPKSVALRSRQESSSNRTNKETRWPTSDKKRSVLGRVYLKRYGGLFCLGAICLAFTCKTSQHISRAFGSRSAFKTLSPRYIPQRPLFVQIIDRDANRVSRLLLDDDPEHLVHERKNRFWVNHGLHKDYHSVKQREKGCVPLGDWQDAHHPSCLKFHEVNFFNMELVGSGVYRDTWMVRDFDGTKQAIKTLRAWNKIGGKREVEYNHVNMNNHRLDAVASSATSSNYVTTIYGYCSNSALSEFSSGGNLSRRFYQKRPKGKKLLKVALDLAMGLADLHNVDSQGRATIAHRDLKPDQFIWYDGRYKITDFNMAALLSWHPQEERYCKTYAIGKGRYNAPEQLLTDSHLPSDKIDVYALGSVYFFLLTGMKPFQGLGKAEAALKIKRGILPKASYKNVKNRRHPAVVAIAKALEMCWIRDPKERPAARDIANFLQKEYSNL